MAKNYEERAIELGRKLAEHVANYPTCTHLVVQRPDLDDIIAFIETNSAMIDRLGDMTERCYRAEAERDHLRETAQQRWEERNAAKEVAQAFWPLVKGHPLAEAEDNEDWLQRFPWLASDASKVNNT